MALNLVLIDTFYLWALSRQVLHMPSIFSLYSSFSCISMTCSGGSALYVIQSATRAVAIDISKAFDRVWHAGLLHKIRSSGISDQIFDLDSSFISNRRLPVVLDRKSSQEYPINTGAPQGSILGPTLFLLYINDLPDDVICNIAIYADDTTLYSKCDQISDLWQQLELPSELESDLRDTVGWGRKWLADFNAGEDQIVLFDRPNSTGVNDVEME